jgi:hypothetical protein
MLSPTEAEVLETLISVSGLREWGTNPYGQSFGFFRDQIEKRLGDKVSARDTKDALRRFQKLGWLVCTGTRYTGTGRGVRRYHLTAKLVKILRSSGQFLPYGMGNN